MKNRLRGVLEAYRQRPESQADQSLWEFVAERDPWIFAHHPAAPSFRDHVWKIGGLYFCKGCVVTFCGILFGVAFFAASRWLHWLSDIQAGAIFLVLLLPTILVHLWNLPRVFKHISRFLLGFLMASAFFLLFVTDSWLVRLVVLGSYFAAKIPMERKRKRENRKIENRCGCEPKNDLKTRS